MVDRKPEDSSRDLLEQLEDGWGTPIPAPRPLHAEAGTSRSSSPDLEALDDGWLDDLFPGKDVGDEEEDEEDANEEEPELPDARLDPEAFARAKKERAERAAKKREKKRAKAEAKRARQKARSAAMRQRQKTKKSRGGQPTESTSRPAAAATEADVDAHEVGAQDPPRSTPKPRVKAVAPARRPSTTDSIKLLAIVLLVLLSLAALAAVIAK